MAMEIRARKKADDIKKVKKVGSSAPVIQFPGSEGRREDRQREVERFSYVIAIRCNTMLYNTIQNAIVPPYGSLYFSDWDGKSGQSRIQF